MSARFARHAVGGLVAAALALALSISALAPAPAKLPAAALDQPALYHLEISLLVFYGLLLLITPVHSALVGGKFPTEISTRGARFAEKADDSVKKVEAAVETLERKNRLLTEGLRTARREIRHLSGSDNTQPGVNSKQ
jgi:hypothetical protein